MNPRTRLITLAAALVAVALGLVACEDSDLTAPGDASIVLTANPATVVINQNAGQTQNISQIRATVFDGSGVALSGITVIFSTTGGSVTPTVKTDANGAALATLTLTLDDPEVAEVTARSSSVSANVVVERSSVSVNRPPLASFQMVPPRVLGDPNDPPELRRGQLVNRPVAFDGTTTTDPDNDPITCWRWDIDSTVDSADVILQGTTLSNFDRTFREPMIINTTLRVSDNPAAAALCGPSMAPVPLDVLSPNSEVIADYPIDCDNPPPVADAGQDIRQTVAQGLAVTVDGSRSFDNETSLSGYSWNCGNGFGAFKVTPIAVCNYFAAGTYQATLRVCDFGLGDVDGDGQPDIGPNGDFLCKKCDQDQVLIEIF